MSRRNVLIVGEDDLIAWAIRKRFSAMQISTVVVRTAKEAFEELARNPYNLVVLDAGLLEGEEPEFLGRFLGALAKAGPPEKGVGEPGRDRRSIDVAGGIRCIEKPFSVLELDGIVESLAGRFSEKRGASRRLCTIPVGFSFPGTVDGKGGIPGGNPTGTAAEVGGDGLRVCTAHPLVTGQQLCVFPLGAGDPLAGFVRHDRTAEVIWVVPDEDGVIAGLRYIS